jgi:hypothetical protein
LAKHPTGPAAGTDESSSESAATRSVRKQRDIIAEILEKRSRLMRRADRYRQFTERNDAILDAIDLLAKHARHDPYTRMELLRYVPIGIVACWEGYVRLLIRDLVNLGQPYRENAARLDVGKFDVDAVLAIGGKRISTGELISHQLRINNLDDINKHLSTVMGFYFLEELMRTHAPDNDMPLFYIADKLFRDINGAFEMRHIFCHELAVTHQPTLPMVRSMGMSSMVFTYHTEILVQQMLGGEPPEL